MGAFQMGQVGKGSSHGAAYEPFSIRIPNPHHFFSLRNYNPAGLLILPDWV